MQRRSVSEYSHEAATYVHCQLYIVFLPSINVSVNEAFLVVQCVCLKKKKFGCFLFFLHWMEWNACDKKHKVGKLAKCKKPSGIHTYLG